MAHEEVLLEVNGMTCAGCANTVESNLLSLDGVISCSISFLTHRARVAFQPDVLAPQALVDAVVSQGFRATVLPEAGLASLFLEPSAGEISISSSQLLAACKSVNDVQADSVMHTNCVVMRYDPNVVGARDIIGRITAILVSQLGLLNNGDSLVMVLERPPVTVSESEQDMKSWLRRFYISMTLAIPTFLIAFVLPYSSNTSEAFKHELATGSLLTVGVLIMWLFATVVLLYVGYPVSVSAYLSVFQMHEANMDVLVFIAASVAYFYSLICVLLSLGYRDYFDDKDSFFESTTILLALISLGRWLELRAKGNASHAIAKLLALQPTTAYLAAPTSEAKVAQDDWCSSEAAPAASQADCCSAEAEQDACCSAKSTSAAADGFCCSSNVVPSDDCCAKVPPAATQGDGCSSTTVQGDCSPKASQGVYRSSEASAQDDCCSSKSAPLDRCCSKAAPVAAAQAECSSKAAEEDCCAFKAAPVTAQADCCSFKSATVTSQADCCSSKAKDPTGYIWFNRTIPIALLHRNDYVRVLPGQTIPADGVVVQGESTVNESTFSGEPIPVPKSPGDEVMAASTNQLGALLIRVTRLPHESILAGICELVSEAQASKAHAQRTADAVAAVFTPTVLVLAMTVFIVWFVLALENVVSTGSAHAAPFALQFALSMLVVSCPCAIMLAVPTVVMVASGVGANFGILIKGGHVLEACSKVTDVAFDKTGTITLGSCKILKVYIGDKIFSFSREDGASLASLPGDDWWRRFWEHILIAECQSEHILARAAVDFARQVLSTQFQPPTYPTVISPGGGISVQTPVSRILVGTIPWLASEGVPVPSDAIQQGAYMYDQGLTVSAMAVDGELLGLIGFGDVIRPEARVVIAALRSMGLRVHMLTGDAEGPARAMAAQAGIDLECIHSQCSPSEKADFISRLQEKGDHVAMVGDGVNDAVALSAASVGFAIGAGSQIAIEAADVVLVTSNVIGVFHSLHLARAARHRVILNFLWAFLYNFVAITFSSGLFYQVGGIYIPPGFAGLSEALSSVPVILNSLLLLNYHPPLLLDNVDSILARTLFEPTGKKSESASLSGSLHTKPLETSRVLESFV
eukprot:m.10237 g.10237  ORF g.10237 m.10237 type:complete len:1092 (-) comp2505_c0_seq2:102-3377(-)